MSSDEAMEEIDGDSFGNVKQRLKDRSKKVVQTKEIMSKKAVQTKEMLSKQAVKIAKQAEAHERFINKVTHLLGVLGFGGFCFLLGARPQDIHYVYCLFYVTFVPLRWIYYRFKKWHYYLLDFCYYANTIFLIDLLLYPKNEKLFMVCFSFAEGPLAWALIVWRCSLVFNSVDKIVSVLIHLLPGIVFFTIRWWNPETFAAMHPEGSSQRASWPYVENKSYLLTWLFLVPLGAYTLWQVLYFLIVNVLRRQRLLKDPEVMTSYRELSKKAQKANNVWWRLSGLLGDQNRMLMYIAFQAIFTVATMALTVPIFLSYELHVLFQVLKVSAAVWNGGSFLLEVMPKQVILKEKKKAEIKPAQSPEDQSSAVRENTIETNNSSDATSPGANPEALSDPEYSDEENVLEGEEIQADEDLLEEYEDDEDEVNLVHCRISSIPALRLERFAKLQKLCLRQNQISTIEFPESLGPILQELDLYDNAIAHIKGLEGLTELTSLDLSFNKIKHIKRLETLTKLRDLYFVQNKIQTIEGLSTLTHLRNLELGANRIREIQGLDTLTALEELWLGKNKITQISGLDALSNLTILSIQSNRLTSIQNISHLQNLEQLHISHNALASLAGLESNTKLSILDISNNPIESLAGLGPLKHLSELWASYCLIKDIGEVERELADKEELETVYFEGNPLQTRQMALYRNKVRLALPRVRQIDATFVRVE